MALSSIILITLFIVLYLLFYKSIPGKGWKKGIVFGLMIWIIKAVPEAFNQWMLFDYPAILIIIPLINGLIGMLIFGFLLSLIFEKFKVIEK